MGSTNTAAKSRSSITLVTFKYTRHHLKKLTLLRLNFPKVWFRKSVLQMGMITGAVHIFFVYKVIGHFRVVTNDKGQTTGRSWSKPALDH